MLKKDMGFTMLIVRCVTLVNIYAEDFPKKKKISFFLMIIDKEKKEKDG